MTTNFAGWEQISKKLDRLFNQYGVTEDIPDNADIAEFFKTAEFNTIYRARPNRGILNTCIPNTSYSFYSREANNIVGYDTQGNLYIGGFVNLSFIGWRQIAMSDEHHIKTYTTLEQLNLSDDEMVEDDFVGNLAKINAAIGDNACFVLLSDVPQFINSIVKQLKDDGIDYSVATYRNINFKMERAVSMWNPIKIELFMDMNGNSNFHRDETIIGYANADGSGFKWYPFREMAKTEIFRETIIPLNGWGLSYGYVSKVGNQVSINVTMTVGTKTNGTVIFTMPSDYTPIGQAIFTVISNSSNNLARVVALNNGNFTVFDIGDASGLFCFSGTYTVA